MSDRFTMQIGIHGRLAILNERHRLPETFEKMRAGEITLTEYLDVVAAGSDVRILLVKDVARVFGLPATEIADNADLVIVKVKTEPYGTDLFTVSEFEFCLPEGARQ